LPGVEGRIDDLLADIGRRRALFLASLGNNTVEVVELIASQGVQAMKGREPQGIRCVPT
jgi:hypothetical protein